MTWVPQDITGVAAVWVADDIAQSDATAVSSWLDRITSHSLAQTSTKRPLYRTAGINSQPSVDFDGTDDLLVYTAANAVTTASSGHVFAVCNVDTVTATRTIWGTADTSGGSFTLSGFINSSSKQGISQNAGGTSDILTGATLSTGTNYLLEWRSTDTAYEFRQNGVTESLTVTSGSNTGDWASDTTGRDNFTVGGLQRNTETSFFDGKIAAVIVVNGTISNVDEDSLYRWVNTKYGLLLPTSQQHVSVHILAAKVAESANSLHVVAHAAATSIKMGIIATTPHVRGTAVAAASLASHLFSNVIHGAAHTVAAVATRDAGALHVVVHTGAAVAEISTAVEAPPLHVQAHSRLLGIPAHALEAQVNINPVAITTGAASIPIVVPLYSEGNSPPYNPQFTTSVGAESQFGAALLDGSVESISPVPNLAGASVTFSVHELGGSQIFEHGAVLDNSATGLVHYVVQEGEFSTAGKYLAKFHVVYDEGGRNQAFPADRYIEVIVQ